MRSRVDVGQAILEGAATAAWIAVPDYAVTRRRRSAAKAVILAVSVAGAIATESTRPDPTHSGPEAPEAPEDDAAPVAEEASPSPARRAIAASAVMLALASPFLFSRGVGRGAAWLEGHGVRRPRTVIGVAIGAVTTLGRLTADR